ncbi:MAG: hydroxymethylbilane synthase [Acidobacteriota bacterium]
MPRLVIGSRGSTLALVQAGQVREALQKKNPRLRISILPIRTQGDREMDLELTRFPGKGIFVKEIEDALLSGKIDVAVHSLKDVPSELPPGLTLAAVPRREDSRDCLVTLQPSTLEDLPAGSRVGTGSPRRVSQILAYRNDLRIVPLRGNIGTRLRKLREGECEAVILAHAGIRRLGLEDIALHCIDPDICLPAPGQGALGIEVRENDTEILGLLRGINHSPSSRTVQAERAFLAGLGGGCRVPIAALATVRGQGKLLLRGLVSNAEGTDILRFHAEGKGSPEDLGERLARKFLERGGERILRAVAGGG